MKCLIRMFGINPDYLLPGLTAEFRSRETILLANHKPPIARHYDIEYRKTV